VEWTAKNETVYTKAIPVTLDNIHSVEDFYSILGINPFIRDGSLTDYSQLLMNDKDHGELLKTIKSNGTASEKRNQLRRFQIEAEWQRKAPIPCSFIPEGDVYFLREFDAARVTERFFTLISCSKEQLINFLSLETE